MLRAPRMSSGPRASMSMSPPRAVQARRVQFQRAARLAVLARVVAAGAQVDARAAVQAQRALAGLEFDDGAVGRVDDLAVAVDAQRGAVRVQHGIGRQAQAVARRQADAAHADAAGVDAAGHREAAGVDRDIDFAGADFVADGQVAALDLEAARAVDRARVQALVQRGEIQLLGADVDGALGIRHARAAGLVVARGAAQDAALQVDAARAGIQRDGRQAAGAVVAGRQVDDAAGGLGDVAVAAFQDGFAAPAVFGQLLEWHGPARQVQLRLAGQDQRPVGAQRHLPEGRAMRPSMLSRPASSQVPRPGRVSRRPARRRAWPG